MLKSKDLLNTPDFSCKKPGGHNLPAIVKSISFIGSFSIFFLPGLDLDSLQEKAFLEEHFRISDLDPVISRQHVMTDMNVYSIDFGSLIERRIFRW